MLAHLIHSLPPILHRLKLEPMSSCSKAPRGLFVLLRVTRIFTGHAISPSPPSRQCPSRYAFRAGRNLPDKGFRYLRTVIVTAAVHRGFNSKLSLFALTYRHWAGVSPYTSAFALARTCVFDKQSLRPILCGLKTLSTRSLICLRLPLFRSYGVNLPSSLRMVFSFTLGLLPLSTCVGFRYGHNIPINEAFLGDVVLARSFKAEALKFETPSVNNVTVLLTTITSLRDPTRHVQ